MMRKKIWILLILLLGNNLLLLAQHCHIGDLITNSADGSRAVVFYVNPQGTGGWAVSLNDLPTACNWGRSEDIPDLANYPNNINLMREFDGKENTRKIRDFHQDDPDLSSFAAGMVDFENGWYLPSIGQLRILYSNMALIQSTLDANGGTSLSKDRTYWSSTEVNGGKMAFSIQTNTNNTVTYGGKFYPVSKTKGLNYVRPICDFSIFDWDSESPADSLVVSPSETTTYSVTVLEGGICPYVGSITVTVNQLEYEVVDTVVCDSYTWHDTTFTTSGVYTYINDPDAYCQAFDTLYLTVFGELSVTIEPEDAAVCDGDSIILYAVIHRASIGDILCTDGSIIPPDEWSSANGKTAKGIVFYVDASDQHGWALDLKDEPGSFKWCTSYDQVRSLTDRATAREAILDINGYNNTKALRDAAKSNPNLFPVVGQLDLSQGWYLPALGQLRYMYAYIHTINHSLEILGGDTIKVDTEWSYWTSTQYNAKMKWKLDHTGSVSNAKGITEHKVRGVCSF